MNLLGMASLQALPYQSATSLGSSERLFGIEFRFDGRIEFIFNDVFHITTIEEH